MSNKGNKALTYPIGLITLDEVIFSGFAWRATENINNRGHYLSMGHVYWTMTPVGLIYREEKGRAFLRNEHRGAAGYRGAKPRLLLHLSHRSAGKSEEHPAPRPFGKQL